MWGLIPGWQLRSHKPGTAAKSSFSVSFRTLIHFELIFFSFFFSWFFKHWRMVSMLLVSHVKWFSCTYIFFFWFFSIVGYYKILSIVLCVNFFFFNLFPSPPCANFYVGYKARWELLKHNFFFFFFNFTILYWFCQILKWIRHRYTCVPHPEPSSLLPPHTIPLGRPVHQPQASSIVHRTWTGDLFHTWYYTCFNAILPNLPTFSLSQSP